MAQTAQANVNAEVVARMIDQMGQNVSQGIVRAMELRYRNREIDLQSLQKIKDFMALPAEKRKALLQDPQFRTSIEQAMAPQAFRTARSARKISLDQRQSMEQSAMSLGEETSTEKAERLTKEAGAQKATAEAKLAELKNNIATGVTAPTPLNLLMTGDVKDPLAGALFSNIGKEDLTNLALFEKKAGPLYTKQQQQEWYGKMLQEGLPPGVAMQSAIAIANGEWDKVPTAYRDATTGRVVPVRAKAEQQLAIDAMNARSRAQEVQNNIQSSIATSAASLAEKSGLSLDQASQDVIAMRSGKKIPFPTPALTEHAQNDLLIQRQEIEKNKQSILNDQSGVGMIKETLTALTAAYKEQQNTIEPNSAATADLKDKIQQLQQELTSRLAGRYGIKFDSYEQMHPFSTSVSGAISSIYDSMKTAGAFGLDFSKDTLDGIGQILQQGQEEAKSPTSQASLYQAARFGTGPAIPKQSFTADQQNIVQGLVDSVTKALSDDNTPVEQKKSFMDYYNNILKPVIDDPSKFNLLFTQPPASKPGGDDDDDEDEE